MKYLTNKKVLKVSGADAPSFLQGQLTNDITKITENQAQLNALCQHQGKIIALLTIIKKDADFYLIVPESMLEIVKNRLSMFIIMSAVEISESDYSVIGCIGEDDCYHLTEEISYELSKEMYEEDDFFKLTCIENKIPEIYPETSEKFVPQMLNLDIDEFGVNFKKGCYTGQEVVARLHYLGKAKRRMYKFSADFEVKVGDELQVGNSHSLKASGIVVEVLKGLDGYKFLATMEVDKTTSEIFINSNKVFISE